MRKGSMTICALLCFAAPLWLTASGPQRIALMEQRSSPQDLAISGDVPGIPPGATRYVRYDDLLKLQQISFTPQDDANFSRPVQLSGVPLDEVAAALGAQGRELIAAICRDGYEGHFTAEYIAEHHPILVLKVGGKAPEQWPRSEEGDIYAPYLVSQERFTPAFHVLAHEDEPQIPFGMTALKFYEEDFALAALRPHGGGGAAMEGMRIAEQNCLRCHRAAKIGGTKSPFGWPQLAMIAQGNPSAFGKYVVQPQRVNPEATMPGNPKYDAATIAALTAYFQNAGDKP